MGLNKNPDTLDAIEREKEGSGRIRNYGMGERRGKGYGNENIK